MTPTVEPTLAEGLAHSPSLYSIAVVGAVVGTILGVTAIALRADKPRARVFAFGAILTSALTTVYGFVGWLTIRSRTDEAVAAIASTLTEGQMMLTRAAGYAEAKLMLYFAASVALVPLFIGIVSVFFLRRPTTRRREHDVENHPLGGQTGEAAA